MAIPFPVIRTAIRRTITPGGYPVRQFVAMNGATTTIARGSKPFDARLVLEFPYINDTDVALIWQTWYATLGGGLDVELPANAFSGVDSALVAQIPPELTWYMEEPQIRSVRPLLSDARISFVGRLTSGSLFDIPQPPTAAEFISCSVVQTSLANAYSAPLSGLDEGDLVVGYFSTSAGSLTVPAGWTVIDQRMTGDFSNRPVAIAWKLATGAEINIGAWNGTSTGAVAISMVFRGSSGVGAFGFFHSTDPFGAGITTNRPIVIPALTLTNTSGDSVVGALSSRLSLLDDAFTGKTVPPGMTAGCTQPFGITYRSNDPVESWSQITVTDSGAFRCFYSFEVLPG
jgi:hypothetical protein